MTRRTPRPSSVGAAAVTVLSAGLAAAFTLASAPAVVSLPAPAVVAASQTAPVPVELVFPAPVAEQPAPVAAPPPPAPQPAPQPAKAAPRPVATADPRCAGEGWQQRRGQAAVEQLRRPSDSRVVEVQFRPARGDVLGMAHLQEQRLELFVRSCDRQSDALVLHVLAHELGHLLDARQMDDDARAAWRAVRGIPAGTPWFGCNACTDFATPAGDFAEVYAQWQRRASSNRSELAGDPSPAELEELAARFF